jgi:hypothetical protein
MNGGYISKSLNFYQYGKQINEDVSKNNTILVKVLNESEKIDGYQFEEGLNINGMDDNPIFSFTNLENIFFFLEKVNEELFPRESYYRGVGENIRLVEIPNDSKIYVREGYMLSNKIILGKKFSNICEFSKYMNLNYSKIVEMCNLNKVFDDISNPLRKYYKYFNEFTNDEKLFYEIAKKEGIIFRDFPEKFKTDEICKIAVFTNYFAMEEVPDNIINGKFGKEICLEAAKNSLIYNGYIRGEIFNKIPSKYINYIKSELNYKSLPVKDVLKDIDYFFHKDIYYY